MTHKFKVGDRVVPEDGTWVEHDIKYIDITHVDEMGYGIHAVFNNGMYQDGGSSRQMVDNYFRLHLGVFEEL